MKVLTIVLKSLGIGLIISSLAMLVTDFGELKKVLKVESEK